MQHAAAHAVMFAQLVFSEAPCSGRREPAPGSRLLLQCKTAASKAPACLPKSSVCRGQTAPDRTMWRLRRLLNLNQPPVCLDFTTRFPVPTGFFFGIFVKKNLLKKIKKITMQSAKVEIREGEIGR